MQNSYSIKGRDAYRTRNTQQAHLVESHLELVKTLAKFIMSCNQNCSWLTMEDLMSAGDEALVKAAYAYDSTERASFKTYASRCVMNAMFAEIRSMFPVKVSHKQLKDLSVVSGDADEFNGANTGLSVFDAYQSEAMKVNWETEEEALLERLDDAMDQLKWEERELIRCRYGFEGEPMTLCQLAKQYQKTQQAMHKRLNRIHDKLQVLVVDEGLNYRLSA